MNNAVHFLTGAAWGIVHGILTTQGGSRRPALGLATGAAAWAASYTMLAPAGLYKPMWDYPREVLGRDLSAHLVFGLGLGTAAHALAGRDPG